MRARSLGSFPLLTLAAALCALVAASGPARAQDDEEGNDNEFIRDGAWLSVSGVGAFQNTRDDFKNRDSTAGFQLRAGMRFAPPLSVGIYGEWLNFQGANPVSVGAMVKLFPIELFDTSLLGGRVQPYFFGGAGAMFADDTGSSGDDVNAGGNFRGGGGVDVYATENLVAFSEVHYSGAGGDVTGLESLNVLLGLSWRF